MDHINIDMPDQASAESLAAAINAAGGMEDPERKGVYSKGIPEVTTRQAAFDNGLNVVSYLQIKTRYSVRVKFPPPKSDIPALIKAWHADPNQDNYIELCDGLYRHPTSPFCHGGLQYWCRVDKDSRGGLIKSLSINH